MDGSNSPSHCTDDCVNKDHVYWHQTSGSHPFGSLLDLAHQLKLKEIRMQSLCGDLAPWTPRDNVGLDADFRQWDLVQKETFMPPVITPPIPNWYMLDVDHFMPPDARKINAGFGNSGDQEFQIGLHNNMDNAQSLDHQLQNDKIVKHASRPSRETTTVQLHHRYQCNKCTYETDNRAHMRRHQASRHDAEKPFCCYVCHRDFARSDHVRVHFVTMHPDVPYNPQRVRKPLSALGGTSQDDGYIEAPDTVFRRMFESCPLSSEQEPEIHPIVRDKQPVEEISQQSSPTFRSWQKYCQLVKPVNGNGCYFKCLCCMHSGVNVWHLKLHYLQNHTNLPLLMCRVCQYSTGSLSRLIIHMTDHGELFCHQCHFSTTDPLRFEAHQQSCTGLAAFSGGKSFQCPVCGDSFPNRNAVKEHVQEVHGRLYCERCECIAYGLTSLDEHECHPLSEVLPLDENLDSNDSVKHEINTDEVDGDFAGNAENISNSESFAAGRIFDTKQVDLSQIHFKRSADQVYCCHVEGCDFQASWKKSLELHELSYHVDDLNGYTELTGDMLNCPFCPTSRTFRYRRSFEKHLLVHGVEYSELFSMPVAQSASFSGSSFSPSGIY